MTPNKSTAIQQLKENIEKYGEHKLFDQSNWHSQCILELDAKLTALQQQVQNIKQIVCVEQLDANDIFNGVPAEDEFPTVAKCLTCGKCFTAEQTMTKEFDQHYPCRSYPTMEEFQPEIAKNGSFTVEGNPTAPPPDVDFFSLSAKEQAEIEAGLASAKAGRVIHNWKWQEPAATTPSAPPANVNEADRVKAIIKLMTAQSALLAVNGDKFFAWGKIGEAIEILQRNNK